MASLSPSTVFDHQMFSHHCFTFSPGIPGIPPTVRTYVRFGAHNIIPKKLILRHATHHTICMHLWTKERLCQKREKEFYTNKPNVFENSKSQRSFPIVCKFRQTVFELTAQVQRAMQSSCLENNFGTVSRCKVGTASFLPKENNCTSNCKYSAAMQPPVELKQHRYPWEERAITTWPISEPANKHFLCW